MRRHSHASICAGLAGVLALGVALIFYLPAHGAATVTSATGGTSISVDTVGGSYTTLTGPVVSEGDVGEIEEGNIILNAPVGFEFRTTANSVTATRTNINGGSCTGSGNKVLKIDNGTSDTVTPTTIRRE
ncbi:MAG: hypothetical protein FJY98_02565 [Candidatus Liptonbacteria bacterium]|nr:hypothetical protein [Candidatus Liptonbacteria bacterium]